MKVFILVQEKEATKSSFYSNISYSNYSKPLGIFKTREEAEYQASRMGNNILIIEDGIDDISWKLETLAILGDFPEGFITFMDMGKYIFVREQYTGINLFDLTDMITEDQIAFLNERLKVIEEYKEAYE